MELVATLSLNSSVRTGDIEAVDQAFAFACANILDRLLGKLETELYAHIGRLFRDFQARSTDYAAMVATQRASATPQITTYINKLEFLAGRVRHERLVPWTDPQAEGRMYLYCAETAVDEDEDSDGLDEGLIDGSKGRGRSTIGGGLVETGASVSTQDLRELLQTKISSMRSMDGLEGSPTHSKQQSEFNTSGSGWRFSETPSFILTAAGEQPNSRTDDSQAPFNPDIVVLSVEYCECRLVLDLVSDSLDAVIILPLCHRSPHSRRPAERGANRQPPSFRFRLVQEPHNQRSACLGGRGQL